MEEIIAKISRLGANYNMLLNRDVIEHITHQKKPLEYADEILRKLPGIHFIDLDTIKGIETPTETHTDPDMQDMIKMSDLNTCSSGEIKDFADHFLDRFKKLKAIFEQRPNFESSVPLEHFKDGRLHEGDSIVMIRQIKNGKENRVFLELEDESSCIKCYYSKIGDEILVEDEVIAVHLKAKNHYWIVDRLHLPEVPLAHKMQRTDKRIAFISDLHIGSKNFLVERWEEFIKWIQDPFLDYLLIAGDLVDGIGIYPDQEKDLEVSDIFKQYELLARAISRIPERIKIILQPGNHDAVRQAEPQPPFSKEIMDMIYPAHRNTLFLPNPCMVEINGIKILAYHGRSIDDWVTASPRLDHNKPIDCMIEMLKARHLAPFYGGRTPLAPTPRDDMVISQIPDIFVAGHVHTYGIMDYRGILLINASTWQSQTSFQKTLGFIPDPCKVTVLDMNDISKPKTFAF